MMMSWIEKRNNPKTRMSAPLLVSSVGMIDFLRITAPFFIVMGR
jgi:hypothetical protein